MKKEARFKVGSQVKNILGRDLITDSNIAVLELVKNSYDAHATQVTITFEGDSLIIADNGKGMTEEDLIEKWLLLAYSAKKDNTEDASYRDTIKRKYAGAKGIGRLSCDRLGRYLTLATKSKNDSHIIEMTIDWHDYELNPRQEFDDIPVSYEVADKSSLIQSSTGTILKISGLHDSWTTDEILSLRKSLEKLINPFHGADDFEITFCVPSELENDLIKKDEAERLRAEWSTLSPQKQSKAVRLERSIINGPIVNSIGEVLNLKTTRIDSIINNGRIHTKLVDRGVVIYEIEEGDKYNLLKDVSISLFYLNKQAKYNFSVQMGTSAVNYGSVFLFRNGFRILPYGQFGNDGWGIDQRIQQGYNRFLGSRELLGRVDVETDDPEAFKEVSSRDGGLINTPAFQQLKDFFWLTHKRLERYVVGVLWGEGFLRRDYFQRDEDAKSLRKKLHDSDKESETIEHVINNIGSKVDFLQLVKTLVNDDTITLLYYNEDLANIVSNVDDTEVIQNQLIDDLRKVAAKTNDTTLLQNLTDFENQLDILRRQKQEAERQAAEAKERAKQESKKAAEEKKKRKEEEDRRKEKEKELEAQKQKNLYLAATQNTSPEVKELMHAIAISSNDLDSLINIIATGLRENTITESYVINKLDEMSFHTSRIIKISKMLTKADINFISEAHEIDIQQYIKEYVQNFENSINIKFGSFIANSVKKIIPAIELSIIIDNLVSNSKKAGATEILLDFNVEGSTIEVLFSDNGKGVDLNRYTPDSIFDPGVTDRRGGSGIGLSTIRNRIDKDLNGEIEFVGNGIKYSSGATFKLVFY